MISLIVAMTRNRVIGQGGRMPWHLPADLRHFRKLTMGKPIVMGRKTFESIGKALPGRRNIVVTRQQNYQARDCLVVDSLERALTDNRDSREVMIIGGAEIYSEALPRADRIYLTLIECELDGDATFPELDRCQWRQKERIDYPPDDENAFALSFIVLDRVKDTAG